MIQLIICQLRWIMIPVTEFKVTVSNFRKWNVIEVLHILYSDLLSRGSGAGLPLHPNPPELGLGSAAMELSRLVGDRSAMAAATAADPMATLPSFSGSALAASRGDESRSPKEVDDIHRSGGDVNALRQQQHRESNGCNLAANTR
jgi:hypothetical protein